MLNNYIATIANGKNRYKLKIADSIVDENSKKIIINPDEVLNKYEIDEDKYFGEYESNETYPFENILFTTNEKYNELKDTKLDIKYFDLLWHLSHPQYMIN